MTSNRKEAILASLQAGNVIRRIWSGPNQGGYLSHRLEGVKNLRESEVEELRREGLLEITDERRTLSFYSLRLKEGA